MCCNRFRAEMKNSISKHKHLAGNNDGVSNKVKYLEYFITDKRMTDKDIYRQCCKVCAQANMLSCKFSACVNSENVSSRSILYHFILCGTTCYQALKKASL